MTDLGARPGQRKTQQKRSAESKMAILLAAAETFQALGYAATTTAKITQAAGAKKGGSLYYYFESKAEVAQEILGQQVDLVELLPRQSSKIQEAIDVTFFFAHLLQVDPLAKAGVRLSIDGGLPPEVDGLAPFKAWISYAEMLLSQASEAGEMWPNVDPIEVAQTMIGAFSGIQLASELFEQRKHLPERVQALWKLVLPGMVRPGLMPGLDYAADRMARIEFPEHLQIGAS